MRKQSHFLLVRVTVSQEKNVAAILSRKIESRENSSISSILVPDGLDGYVILECSDLSEIDEVIRGMQHIRGRVSTVLALKDIESFLEKKSIIDSLEVGDIVEITSGPLVGEKAQVKSIYKAKDEITVELFETLTPVSLTVPAEMVKLAKKKAE